ncbi:unnamed protein product [Mycena citricolor]|uniref:Lysophospholipase n=1 Tax=Mycena citricolor TaxID=2018698 RepID=A0AAD2HQ16_9AGAR|nr:unnamed protein product [Mycena citricolor]
MTASDVGQEEYFHEPYYDEDTPEQVSYEREMLKQQFAPSSSSEVHASGLAALGDKLKNFAKEVKPSMQLAEYFLSLESRVTKDIYNPELFPEIRDVAIARQGSELCKEERGFLQARRVHVRNHFARYMGLDAESIHPDDVPTVAWGGSGGGYRAMLALLGYTRGAKESGLWDLLTYVAGVSGSCWTIGALYTFADGDTTKLIDHCKERMHPHHPLSASAVEKLLGSERGDYETLGPLIQKHRSGLHTVAMDLYSVFTTGYLFMQTDPALKPAGSAAAEVAGYHRAWWKWSQAQRRLVNGAEPLPILTAIRHERPWKDWVDSEHPFATGNHLDKEHREASDAWFQWFEMSPFEIGCDELAKWCPTFGFGRPFEEGKSTLQLPEQSLALLLGLCTSAPAGPLSSYLSTIQRNLPTGLIGDTINRISSGIAKLWGAHETEIFENHHPLHACNEHNFLFHYTPTPKGQGRPEGIENSPRIHLIDSGMDNNCPTMPLLNPERQVDVIINMDASSDVQKDSFPQRVAQIGSRRGLDFKCRLDIQAGTDPKDLDRFKGLYAQIYDGTLAPRPQKVVDSYGKTVSNPPAPTVTRDCTMVYLPFLPNEGAVPGLDPSTAKFCGSYNLVLTAEQIDMIIKLSMANFEAGEATIKQALMDAYNRKKQNRTGGL